MRGRGPDRMNQICFRRHLPEPPEVRRRPPDSSLRTPRKRRHDFPDQGGTVVGVLCQHFVQEGRAASRHPRNKNGTLDGLALEVATSSPRLLQPQPGSENIAKVNPGKQPAEAMQVS